MHCRGFVSQTSTHPLARLIQVRQERLLLRQPKNKFDRSAFCCGNQKTSTTVSKTNQICKSKLQFASNRQDFQSVAQDSANQTNAEAVASSN
eukprot:jgi/Botrbrau1/17839/Bobra.0127s0082.1